MVAQGISGPDLMQEMRQQSLNCGAEIITETVERIDLSKCAPSAGLWRWAIQCKASPGSYYNGLCSLFLQVTYTKGGIDLDSLFLNPLISRTTISGEERTLSSI